VNYDTDALRQELQEAQFRISELSTALEQMREQRDHYLDQAHQTLAELTDVKKLATQRQAMIDRLQLIIQQGVEL
jgi:flagellar biosynthesis chaperone FliJ